jgi:hypothetical protein
MGQSPVQVIKYTTISENGIVVKKFHEYEGLFFGGGGASPYSNILSVVLNYTTFKYRPSQHSSQHVLRGVK